MPRGRPRKHPLPSNAVPIYTAPAHERLQLLEIQNQELFGAFNDMVDKFNQVMTVVERRLQLLEAGVARPSSDAVSGLGNAITALSGAYGGGNAEH